MIDQLIRDVHVLRKADLLVARIWLNVFARRAGLLAFAALIAVFGLGMANLAGFYALQTQLGAVWAAAIIAAADLAISAVVLLIAVKARPGAELDLALEVRKMAVDSIQTDARDLKLSFDALVQEVKDVKANVAHFVQNPMDLAAQKLLIPAALSILRGIRGKRDHA